MTADDFLVWCLGQEGKWELVDGEPVQMMTGATKRHDRVVVSTILALGTRLRGSPCFPTTADIAARMLNGDVRRPDVTVDCARGDDRALESTAPAVFVEVLSPSTRLLDQVKKPEEYKRVPTLRHIVLLDPERPSAWLLSRDQAGGEWTAEDVEGLDGELRLTGIGIALPLAEIYEEALGVR